jgi:hypothetical protein
MCHVAEKGTDAYDNVKASHKREQEQVEEEGATGGGQGGGKTEGCTWAEASSVLSRRYPRCPSPPRTRFRQKQ